MKKNVRRESNSYLSHGIINDNYHILTTKHIFTFYYTFYLSKKILSTFLYSFIMMNLKRFMIGCMTIKFLS